MVLLPFYAGRIAFQAQCPMLSIRTKYDGLWLGAGMTGEESGQARLQVTLHAAQEEAFSIGHKVGYHTHHTTRTTTSINSLSKIWRRSRCVPNLRSRLAFVLFSKLYRQMYGNTGMATENSGRTNTVRWARIIAKPCHALFPARPMPHLKAPIPDHSPE